jgi:hypothetical protein
MKNLFELDNTSQGLIDISNLSELIFTMVTCLEGEAQKYKFMKFKQLVRSQSWAKIKSYQEWSRFSKQFLIFVNRLLETTPKKQMTFECALNHPIVTGVESSFNRAAKPLAD